MWSKRVNYLSLLILLIFGLIFYHHYVLMILLVIMLVSPVVSYVVTKKSVDKFNVELYSDKTSVGKNVPVDVYFGVENKSVIPVEEVKINIKFHNYFYENKEEYSIIVAALPKKSRTAKITLSGIYCGRMMVEAVSMKIFDVLGMFAFEKDLSCLGEILIMPSKQKKFEKVDLSVLGVSDDEELQYVKGDDVSQISQIRDYIPGDRLQNIHWKLSAKSNELQVKEFSMPYSEDVVLLLEFYVNKEEPEVFDELIETMYAFSMDLIRQGRKFSVMYHGSGSYQLESIDVFSEDDLRIVMNELYYTKPQKENGMTYELYKSLNSDLKGTVLYLSDLSVADKKGLKLDIGSEKVVLTCLQ